MMIVGFIPSTLVTYICSSEAQYLQPSKRNSSPSSDWSTGSIPVAFGTPTSESEPQQEPYLSPLLSPAGPGAWKKPGRQFWSYQAAAPVLHGLSTPVKVHYRPGWSRGSIQMSSHFMRRSWCLSSSGRLGASEISIWPGEFLLLRRAASPQGRWQFDCSFNAFQFF